MGDLSLPLTIRSKVDDRLLALDADELFAHVGSSVLYELEGDRNPPLFVSVLLHGNEISGWLAVRSILQKYQVQRNRHGRLPRSLMLFLGNLEAAAEGKRQLEGQPDYNRIWKDNTSVPGRVAQVVIERASKAGVFAAVDLHNNTGKNPLYGCVCDLAPHHLHLASLFSRTVVYYRKPDTTLATVFSSFAPATTLECGLPGDRLGIERAAAVVDACLRLDHLPSHAPAGEVANLYQTRARILVPPHLALRFGPLDEPPAPGEVLLRDDFETLNFVPQEAGTILGRLEQNQCLQTLPCEEGVCPGFLENDQGWLRLCRDAVPSMFTCNEGVARSDCLGYLMVDLKGTFGH